MCPGGADKQAEGKKEGVWWDRKLKERGQDVWTGGWLASNCSIWHMKMSGAAKIALFLPSEGASDERCLLLARAEIRKDLRSVRAKMRFLEFCPFPPHFCSRNCPSPPKGRFILRVSCQMVQDGFSPPLGALGSLALSQLLALQVHPSFASGISPTGTREAEMGLGGRKHVYLKSVSCSSLFSYLELTNLGVWQTLLYLWVSRTKPHSSGSEHLLSLSFLFTILLTLVQVYHPLIVSQHCHLPLESVFVFHA